MLLVVDNGSVYTDSIISCLEVLGEDHRRVRFDEIAGGDLEGAGSIILSGRRRNDASMNATNSRLVRYAVSSGKPLLGICYGAEILAITLGGTIRRMERPRHGLYGAQVVMENPLCSGRMEVFESHSYRVAALDSRFETLAVSDGCPHEAFRYGRSGIYGTQFHPEMSGDGRELIKNFARSRN